MPPLEPPRPGMRLVIVRWIRHRKTGKRIYPRNGKVFAFWVKDDPRKKAA